MPSLLQLQYFADLAHQEHMTEVASKYFISQSALSNSLLRLETELGIRIFDRIGRNLVLNEYGRAYLTHVETALKALEEGKRALELLKGTRSQTVSVAMSTSLHLGNLISRFLQQHPQYTFNQHKYSITDSNRLLDVDFIIASDDDLSSEDLEHVVFREEQIWLRVPPNSPLAQRDAIYLIEAKDERFISLPKSASFSRFSDKLFKMAGFIPNIVAECDSDLQQQLLCQNMGVLLHPETVAQSNFFNYGTNLLIKDDFAIRKHCLYWSKNKKLSKAAIAFRSFLLTSLCEERLPEYEEPSE